MARQTIVDFFKGAQTSSTPAPLAPKTASPELEGTGKRIVSPVDVERAYVELAKPVLDALSTGTPMAEGELFKHVDASNIMQFRTAIEEMKTRGLVKIVGFNQPFNEPIYGQASGPILE
jgi:hypothetical protein